MLFTVYFVFIFCPFGFSPSRFLVPFFNVRDFSAYYFISFSLILQCYFSKNKRSFKKHFIIWSKKRILLYSLLNVIVVFVFFFLKKIFICTFRDTALIVFSWNFVCLFVMLHTTHLRILQQNKRERNSQIITYSKESSMPEKVNRIFFSVWAKGWNVCLSVCFIHNYFFAPSIH